MFRLHLNPLQVSPQFLLLQQEVDPLSLTWTMFLRLYHRPLYYIMFTACRHLGSDPDLSDTIVKEDYPRTIVTQFGSHWPSSFCREYFWMYFS